MSDHYMEGYIKFQELNLVDIEVGNGSLPFPLNQIGFRTIILRKTNATHLQPQAFGWSTSFTRLLAFAYNQLTDEANVFRVISHFIKASCVRLRDDRLTLVPKRAFYRLPKVVLIDLRNNYSD